MSPMSWFLSTWGKVLKKVKEFFIKSSCPTTQHLYEQYIFEEISNNFIIMKNSTTFLFLKPSLNKQVSICTFFFKYCLMKAWKLHKVNKNEGLQAYHHQQELQSFTRLMCKISLNINWISASNKEGNVYKPSFTTWYIDHHDKTAIWCESREQRLKWFRTLWPHSVPIRT